MGRVTRGGRPIVNFGEPLHFLSLNLEPETVNLLPPPCLSMSKS
jgi:hypothetical protein